MTQASTSLARTRLREASSTTEATHVETSLKFFVSAVRCGAKTSLLDAIQRFRRNSLLGTWRNMAWCSRASCLASSSGSISSRRSTAVAPCLRPCFGRSARGKSPDLGSTSRAAFVAAPMCSSVTELSTRCCTSSLMTSTWSKYPPIGSTTSSTNASTVMIRRSSVRKSVSQNSCNHCSMLRSVCLRSVRAIRPEATGTMWPKLAAERSSLTVTGSAKEVHQQCSITSAVTKLGNVSRKVLAKRPPSKSGWQASSVRCWSPADTSWSCLKASGDGLAACASSMAASTRQSSRSSCTPEPRRGPVDALGEESSRGGGRS
mmetsp:Transcript_17049/g.66428  ORF Transcript_17049/g.66428 Transcript_17049/m.66428 type:complete len:318 (+) Transcript_17049:1608-2561(+)